MTPEAQHDAWERDGYPREWEEVGACTYRMPVVGGWLVHYGVSGDLAMTVAMVFIPDPTHRWRLAD